MTNLIRIPSSLKFRWVPMFIIILLFIDLVLYLFIYTLHIFIYFLRKKILEKSISGLKGIPIFKFQYTF